MKSQREIERKYKVLLIEVSTDPFYTKTDLDNRVNCYKCSNCNHITKTRDIDPGVTPFIIACEKCNSEARSTFYNDISPDVMPSLEFYRPGLKEVMKMRNSPNLLQHVLAGGLVYRKVAYKLNNN